MTQNRSAPSQDARQFFAPSRGRFVHACSPEYYLDPRPHLPNGLRQLPLTRPRRKAKVFRHLIADPSQPAMRSTTQLQRSIRRHAHRTQSSPEGRMTGFNPAQCPRYACRECKTKRPHVHTPDLVKTAASWAARAPSGVTHAPNPFAQSRNWERIDLPTLMPMLCDADSFKKPMDLPPNFHPHIYECCLVAYVYRLL
jgi:hypothetical protein